MKTPEGIIVRPHYLEKVRPFMEKPLAKVFLGQRRVGKSYLLFQCLKDLKKHHAEANFIYLNKEDIEFDRIQTASDLTQWLDGQLSKSQRNYVFIDEIQEIREFEKAVRSLLLDDTLDLYVTGSNAELLSGELGTLLAGRTLEVTVFSLSYPEFLLFHQLSDSVESLTSYLKYGGLPYLRNLPLEDEIAFEYLRNIYITILYRDVIARHGIRSNVYLERLLHFMADNIGHLFSANRISQFLKSQKVNLSHNQIAHFTDHLCQAFIIQRARRYDIRGRRIMETGEKYYFENLGIRNILTGFRQADLGQLTENAVYNHLRYLGYQVSVGGLDGNEIDFVAEKGNERRYLQVALRMDSSETLQREFGNLQKINDNYRKQVVTWEEGSTHSYEGIEHISLRRFLMSNN